MMGSMPQEMLILVGGAGTRLRSVVNDVPKPMAPVAGRPFLEYLLDYWIDQGVGRFVLSLGYKGESIKEYFGTRYRNAEISCIQESSPLGTGGAIRMGLQEINWNGGHILLANGDTWFEVDLTALTLDACQHGKPVTIALKTIEINDRYGGVTRDDSGLVTAFGVLSKKNCLINAGCYLIEMQALLGYLRDYPEKFSFEDDVLKPLAVKKQIASSIQNNIFLDIGIPADYHKATEVVGCYKFKGDSA
ncbi:nucleotidyltransferase family protein [Alphaproteobacteria bacterium]|nr:nucleotidyltransferase family protein [Alphaproteobacteria bacterium]